MGIKELKTIINVLTNRNCELEKENASLKKFIKSGNKQQIKVYNRYIKGNTSVAARGLLKAVCDKNELKDIVTGRPFSIEELKVFIYRKGDIDLFTPDQITVLMRANIGGLKVK